MGGARYYNDNDPMPDEGGLIAWQGDRYCELLRLRGIIENIKEVLGRQPNSMGAVSSDYQQQLADIRRAINDR